MQIADPLDAADARHRHGAPALQPRRAADGVGERRCSATPVASTATRRASGSPRSASTTASTSIPTTASPTSPPACASGSRSSSACAATRRSSSSTSRRRCSRRPRASSCSPRCARVVDDEGRAVALVSHKLAEILHATDEVTIMRQRPGRRPRRHRRRRRRRRWPRRWSAATGVAAVRSAPPSGVVETVADARDRRCTAEPRQSRHRWSSTVRGVVGRATADGRAAARRPVARRARRARSSASPASRATASARSATCCRACVDARRRRGASSTATRVATGKAGRDGAAGVGVIPEDRHDSGCVLDLTVAENLCSPTPARVASAGLLDRKAMRGAGDRADRRRSRSRLHSARRADVVAVGRQPAARRAGPRAVGTTRRCSSPPSRRAASTSAPSST